MDCDVVVVVVAAAVAAAAADDAFDFVGTLPLAISCSMSPFKIKPFGPEPLI